MTTQRKITREVLENYLCCKTKGFLTLAGESGAKTDYETWRLSMATQQKADSVTNFVAHHRGRTIKENISLTPSEISSAPDAILSAQLENEVFSVHFDALVKSERSASRQSLPTYIPVLFADAEVKTPQKALLGLLAVILSELQHEEPSIGRVFHPSRKATTVRLEDNLKPARTVLTEIKNVQRAAYTPMLVLNSHCPVCEFRTRCHVQATKEDNLSLLNGMNERQIARLSEKGIFTVKQLSYTFKARRRPKRAKKPAFAAHHLPLRALALREKKTFVYGDPVMPLNDTRAYLDIEGTPQDHTYYLIGVHTISGKRESRASYWADTTSKQEEIRIFANLLDFLSQYPNYTLLHFGTYETTALKRMRKRMGEPYCRQIDDALQRCVNVLRMVTTHIYFPTYSNSLKDIGSFLGHQWSDPSSTGAQTLVWRSRWLSDHDTTLKAKLIEYNSEDCAGLRRLVEFVEQAIASGPSGPFRDQQGTEVVRTSGLSAKREGWSIFGETKYVLDDFRAINKLSYFDYQRERVYARTEAYRKRHTHRRSRVKLQPNETLRYRASRCPSCGNRSIAAVSRREHEVVDLRFTRGGVKRWITRHERWRYRCKRCGSLFLPAAIRDHCKPSKYGRGLISWCMYQLLIGGQNINRIHRTLIDLFGLSIPKTTVYLFKSAAAAYFEDGYNRILSDLIKGNLIHIDETTINLQNDKGYVWVLTSPSSVYFFYRGSREGSFLAEMLGKFRGVLVSDFFTAYDSLDVPQQRCLVHLMRDMNDDLLNYPFDDELKSIITRFSSLLKEIVHTIDRYGLKRWHLNKHNAPAKKFCDWVSNQQFASEAANNYGRRFSKYRTHLFRFLEHDGVPWNNNCAETAIKRFAKFRRTSNGVVTEATISDYLVILSICLTCEYRGIDFLKVLLGRATGDYGFGPKNHTPLRARATRGEPAVKRRARAVGGGTGNLIGREASPDDAQKVNLNRLLPIIFEGFRRSFRGLRYRVVLAPDLWPVVLKQADLEFVLTAFIYIFRRETRRQPLILSARNSRFDKPDPALDLTGRYVAVSLSDGGRVEQLPRPSRRDTVPTGLQADINLDQACMLARALGGAASFKLARTGRKSLTTIVTICIPQYISRPNTAHVYS